MRVVVRVRVAPPNEPLAVRRSFLFGVLMKSIDPQASWTRYVASQGQPTRKRFDALFKAGDRDGIIALALPLIKKFNRTTPKHIREDVESYAIGEVIRTVDTLLARKNENPGSYLIDAIRGAIHEARFGESIEARQCSPATERLFRPRPRKTDPERDRLVSQLQQQGCSPQMIQAECESRGFDQPRIVQTETEWPLTTNEEGDPVLADFGEFESSNDDWQQLIEVHEAGVIDDVEIQLLDAKLQGYTNDECSTIFAAHKSTITKRLQRIKEKLQCHNQTRQRP